MTKLICTVTTLLITVICFSTSGLAQEITGQMETEAGKTCSFVQSPPVEGDLFNRGEILPVITVWFEDLSCVEDTEVNRRKITDVVAGLHGYNDAGFESHEHEALRQFHGTCYTSALDPSIIVNIYYLYDHEYIQGFVHSLPKGDTCTIPTEVTGPGQGMGGAMGMGGMGMGMAPGG